MEDHSNASGTSSSYVGPTGIWPSTDAVARQDVQEAMNNLELEDPMWDEIHALIHRVLKFYRLDACASNFLSTALATERDKFIFSCPQKYLSFLLASVDLPAEAQHYLPMDKTDNKDKKADIGEPQATAGDTEAVIGEPQAAAGDMEAVIGEPVQPEVAAAVAGSPLPDVDNFSDVADFLGSI